jgi:ribose 5-phosphate isomerase A
VRVGPNVALARMRKWSLPSGRRRSLGRKTTEAALEESATGDALALAAVAEVRGGMTVGLGTGRAATRAIKALAQRVSSERLDIVCVATSRESEDLGCRLGLRVQPMESTEFVDYLFDGADEVDPLLRMIKGRGGAMTREKIVAHAAARRVYLVQTSKVVQRLGENAPLPLELLRFGLAATRRELRALGLDGPLRPKPGGAEYETDNGNPVVDAPLPRAADVVGLVEALDALPGLVGHGLFLTEADLLLVEDEQGGVTRRARSHSSSSEAS